MQLRKNFPSSSQQVIVTNKMGKASKWMINFLLGKKQEKEKKKEVAANFQEKLQTSKAIVVAAANPIYKRRWSFGRKTSARKEKGHKLNSKSLDSFPTVTSSSSSLELETLRQHNTKALALALTNLAHSSHRIRKAVEYAAATKIQSTFRSYLAKKALCALRSLVKIQALVRGYLVRKQTSSTLRRMHALMKIQVRARFQRVQMAEEAQPVIKSKSLRHNQMSLNNIVDGAHRGSMDITLHETSQLSKNRYGYRNHSQAGITDQEPRKYYSGDLSNLRREQEYEEFTFFTAQNSPEIHGRTPKITPGRASFTYEQPDYAQTLSHQHQLHPNYMANTESSKAKVRSQSEPKQRPGERIKTHSQDGKINVQKDKESPSSASQSKRIVYENQDPWNNKLCRSTMSKENDCETKSQTSPRYSDFNKFLMAYEPHLTLY